ncbi:MAG: hypothetical protein HWN51_05020 [Desulfobacterales bacterium]|nr:hypothetical protein [Desulfobacterales bacterium]
MRKKHIALLILLLTFLGSTVGNIAANPDIIATATLYASKSYIPVGQVTVAVSDSSLIVTFTTTGDWEMTETHLYVGDIPPDKLAPGKFPFKHEDLGGVTSDEYVIPLAQGGILYIAAHAVVETDDGCWQEETAWGWLRCHSYTFGRGNQDPTYVPALSGWGWYFRVLVP